MKKLGAELFGTFFVALVFNLTIVPPAIGAFAAIAVGLITMTLMAAATPISGGHFNPAITFGALIRGKIGVRDAVLYLAAQVAGAALAGILVNYYRQGGIAPVAAPGVVDLEKVLIGEFLFTLVLVCVFLAVTAREKMVEGIAHGVAVGAVLIVGMYSVFGNTGGVFNPAIAVSRCLTGLGGWEHLWAYFVATFAGGLVGGFLNRFAGTAEGNG
jgi:aquaporin Z